MSGESAAIIGEQTTEHPCAGWHTSNSQILREFLDHVADLIAQDYVRRMRETADPEDFQAWEKGGQQ